MTRSPTRTRASVNRPATLRDIAEAANVHVSTVSRVLTDDPRSGVRQETRALIIATAERLRYRPNQTARSLRLQRTGVLGMLIPDFAHPTYAALVRGAFGAARDAGVAVLIAELQDDIAGASGYQRLVAEKRIDGLLLATSRQDSEMSKQLKQDHVPVVYVNRRDAAGPSVIADDEAGAALAARALIDAGHRRLGIITGPKNIETSERRRAGFLHEAQRRELVRPQISVGDYTASGGVASVRRLLESRRPPTGIFASNLMSGIGALAEAHALGVRVPEDLSLIIFDDAEIAKYTVPALTRVRMPFAEMGAEGVRALMSLLAGEVVQDRMIDVAPCLIEGGSLRSPST